jgi:phosphopantetheinyl transferase
MPLYFEHNISETTKLAIWQIEEAESFFVEKVFLQREITHPHKRLQHLAGRYLLRFLFSDFPNEEIEIASTRKPFLPDEQYHFSISHCGDFAAAIVSKNERVGIDIEIITDKVAKIAHKFLNEAEKNAANRQPSTVNRTLTLIWSAKETVFKWWGKGEVDFKEHIQLSNFTSETQFDAVFCKNIPAQQLTINFQFFNNLCLTFTNNQLVKA